jgi:hypothetical protein
MALCQPSVGINMQLKKMLLQEKRQHNRRAETVSIRFPEAFTYTAHACLPFHHDKILYVPENAASPVYV